MEIDRKRVLNAGQIVIATNCLYGNYRSLTDGEKRNPSDTDGIRGDLALELTDKALSLSRTAYSHMRRRKFPQFPLCSE